MAIEALLHTLIETATNLCQADEGFVYLREGADYVMRDTANPYRIKAIPIPEDIKALCL